MSKKEHKEHKDHNEKFNEALEAKTEGMSEAAAKKFSEAAEWAREFSLNEDQRVSLSIQIADNVAKSGVEVPSLKSVISTYKQIIGL